MRGILGTSFHHALCDISGIGVMLRWLQCELDSTEKKPDVLPCHERGLAQETFEALAEATPEEEEIYKPHWPLHSTALEKWCFLFRKIRSGLRGRPDGVGTVFFSVPASTCEALKGEAEASGASEASSFEVLVSYIGLLLNRGGRGGRCVSITKDYRAALEAAAPGQGLDRLFANTVTHGLAFELPRVAGEAEEMPLAEACTAMHSAINAVTLGYVRWQSKQDHFRGLPNFFGSLCCNSWGHALAGLSFVEGYAIGMRSVDERATNMAFPLDTAYMQLLPQQNGSQTVLLTMPIVNITALRKELPASHFHGPLPSEMRTHSFRVHLPPNMVDALSPVMEVQQRAVRIACIGDSLTACGYPKILQAKLDSAGLSAHVRNFGVAGTTVLRFSDLSYWDEKKLEDARLWRPHFVIATFGTNDSKEGNWESATFEKEYQELVAEFLERLAPRPMVFLVVPPPLCEDGRYEMQQGVINNELPVVIPRVAHAAVRTVMEPLEFQAAKWKQVLPSEIVARAECIDAFEALGGAALARREGYYAEDGVHLNERGTKLLALTVLAGIRRDVGRCLRMWIDAPKVADDSELGF